MPLFKNTAGQKWEWYAVDATTGLPKTGDSANITLYVSKDFGTPTALADVTVTEVSSTNAPGRYRGNLSQTETNADTMVFGGKSSTANVVLVPVTIGTRDYNAQADSLLDRNMATGTDSGGRTPRNALRALRNKVDTAAGIVYKEDDSTTAFTFTTTTNAGAIPITAVDPA